jgi:hypothetical protein
MNCCNSHGECTQGRDCPVRKQRAKETDDAYISRGSWSSVADPYDDITDTFKALIIVIAVTGALTLLAFFIWGK